ncbi:MAG: prenyltransferase/squalene oxidase repeat-containing protein [Oscillochloridaceae bacterium umkhey_bin13]
MFSKPLLQPTTPSSTGLTWLESNRNATGRWGSSTVVRDTTAAVAALARLSPNSSALPPAYAWLANKPPRNTAEHARIIAALARGGFNVSQLTSELLAAQRPVEIFGGNLNAPEGGWGAAPGYNSDSLNTALALEALRAAGMSGGTLPNGVAYLLAASNADGGWGLTRGESNLIVTAHVLLALGGYESIAGVPEAITAGGQYLTSRQNADGGWGTGGSNVIETGLVLYALQERGIAPANAAGANTFLASRQAADGSWNGRAYDTALALLVVDMSPTVATITDLRAERNASGTIVIHWATASEFDVVGFLILRSLDGQRRNAIEVSPIINAEGDSLTGFNYQWEDPELVRDATYWLSVINRDGSIEEYGPVRANSVPNTNEIRQIFLPIIQY